MKNEVFPIFCIGIDMLLNLTIIVLLISSILLFYKTFINNFYVHICSFCYVIFSLINIIFLAYSITCLIQLIYSTK